MVVTCRLKKTKINNLVNLVVLEYRYKNKDSIFSIPKKITTELMSGVYNILLSRVTITTFIPESDNTSVEYMCLSEKSANDYFTSELHKLLTDINKDKESLNKFKEDAKIMFLEELKKRLNKKKLKGKNKDSKKEIKEIIKNMKFKFEAE